MMERLREGFKKQESVVQRARESINERVTAAKQREQNADRLKQQHITQTTQRAARENEKARN
jgi:hypothetical protein